MGEPPSLVPRMGEEEGAVNEAEITLEEDMEKHARVLFSLRFYFLGPHLQHVEGPRLGAAQELQLPAYGTATATWDPSPVCDLPHSSQPHQILNPWSEARDRTCVPMETLRVFYPLSHNTKSWKCSDSSFR